MLKSALALFLAIAEMLGKSAQTDALKYNVEACNAWAFFQAKTIRKTTMEAAAEQMTAASLGCCSRSAHRPTQGRRS